MKPLALSLALLASLLFAVPSKGDAVPVDDFVLDDVGLKLFFSLPESPTPDFFVGPSEFSADFGFWDLPVHVYSSDGLVTGFSAYFYFDPSNNHTGLIMGCASPVNPALPANFCDAIGTPGVGFTDQLFFLGPPNNPTFIPGTYINIQDGFQSSLTITREASETSALTLFACGLAFLLCIETRKKIRRS
jgi:hypothetical protein